MRNPRIQPSYRNIFVVSLKWAECSELRVMKWVCWIECGTMSVVNKVLFYLSRIRWIASISRLSWRWCSLCFCLQYQEYQSKVKSINNPNNINGQLLLPWKIPFDPWLILSLYFGHFCHSFAIITIFGKKSHFERNRVFDQILGSILYLIFFEKNILSSLRSVHDWLIWFVQRLIREDPFWTRF